MFGAVLLAGKSVVTEEEMILGPVLDTKKLNSTKKKPRQTLLSSFPVKSEGTVLAVLWICMLGYKQQTSQPCGYKKKYFYDVFVV
jgi:hypothetical protein